MNAEKEFLCHRLESLAIDLYGTALLLEIAGFPKKYEEMKGASEMCLEWMKSIKEGEVL